VTVGLVVAAFAFVPWLSTSDAPKGDVGARLESGVAGLRKGMESKVGPLPKVDVSGIKNEVSDLKQRAGSAARELETKARNAVDAPSP
jgi:hypothetical protein